MFRFFIIIILIASINNCSINYVLTLDETGYNIKKKQQQKEEHIEDEEDLIDDFIYDLDNPEHIEKYWFDKVLPEIRPNYEQGIHDLENYIKFNKFNKSKYTPYKQQKKKQKYIINKTLSKDKENNKTKLRIYLSRRKDYA